MVNYSKEAHSESRSGRTEDETHPLQLNLTVTKLIFCAASSLMNRAVPFPYLRMLLCHNTVNQGNVESRLHTARLLQLAKESGSIGMLRAE
jgi:hypothetical protein